MVVPNSPTKMSQSRILRTHGSQQYGSVPTISEISGSLRNWSSHRCLSTDSNSLEGESPECNESDPLLSNELWNGSRLNRSMTAKSGEGSSGPTESVCSMVLQILVPFVLAGLGTVSVGMLLDFVQSWDVFQDITEILILVPAVLGMKGNLEMTLASRLSTVVNTGEIESTRDMWMLIGGNLALKQLQATVLGLLAFLIVTILTWIADGEMPLSHIVLLCSTSLSTAFVASLLQGIVVVGVIMGSKRIGINPDNVATPLAGSFGDLITLALLASFSQWFYSIMDFYPHVLYLMDLLYMSLIPVWMMISSKHPASQILLRTGWEPLITAMVISSAGGLILDKAVSDPILIGIVIYAPVINGVGGNLVSIHSSRISTHLHLNYSPGEVPDGPRSCLNPCYTFFGSGANHRSALVLLILVLPGQLVFLHIIHLIKGGLTLPSALFTVFFLLASTIQVFLLLSLADCIVHCLWRRGKDPDSYSIPYLTALGDLLGTALLSLAFFLLWCIGEL
ncbi:solute carrier family 41 member 2 [Cyprinodon tularosa]|uniref:solute carrier family 41 member 2 n=1 Tax=Cyprinodon tularosa TaxID=77115 RepID=UPI0018E1FA59|nr:solute carrier family 41 member 2 [Cyprinodon tularosa]